MSLTSEQLLDVFAGMRRGELVDDVQSRLVVGVSDVHVHSRLRGQKHRRRTTALTVIPIHLSP